MALMAEYTREFHSLDEMWHKCKHRNDNFAKVSLVYSNDTFHEVSMQKCNDDINTLNESLVKNTTTTSYPYKIPPVHTVL